MMYPVLLWQGRASIALLVCRLSLCIPTWPTERERSEGAGGFRGTLFIPSVLWGTERANKPSSLPGTPNPWVQSKHHSLHAQLPLSGRRGRFRLLESHIQLYTTTSSMFQPLCRNTTVIVHTAQNHQSTNTHKFKVKTTRNQPTSVCSSCEAVNELNVIMLAC